MGPLSIVELIVLAVIILVIGWSIIGLVKKILNR